MRCLLVISVVVLFGSFFAAADPPLSYETCQAAANFAENLASCGCPYVGDAMDCDCCSSRGGLDCSGLTSCAFKLAGYPDVYHNAAMQYEASGQWCPAGCSLDTPENCFPGVLFFFCPSGDPQCPGHVVMYIGNGSIAECPETGEDCYVHKIYPSSDYKGCGSYCSGPGPSPPPPPSGSQYCATGDPTTNVRSGPGTGYGLLDSVPQGDEVIDQGRALIPADGYNWRFIEVASNGIEGWMADEYLQPC